MHVSKIQILALEGNSFYVVPDVVVPSRCTITLYHHIVLSCCTISHRHSFGASARASCSIITHIQVRLGFPRTPLSTVSNLSKHILHPVCLLLVQMGCKFPFYVPRLCSRYESYTTTTHTHSKFHKLIFRTRNTKVPK